MANFTVIIKDDRDREHFFRMNNIYVSHGKNGEVEVHAFGGDGAQQRYDNFVQRYNPQEENTHAIQAKERESDSGPQS